MNSKKTGGPLIPQNIIDEILAKVRISDVLSKYTEVKRGGRSLMVKCPFHTDKTPSMSVSDEKGVYHCFSCGRSGNAVGFLMEYKKLGFVDAMTELGREVGIDVEKYKSAGSGVNSKKRERLFTLNQKAMSYFHNALLKSPEGKIARDYLKMRGVSEKSIHDFRLGFGSMDWNAPLEYLKQEGYSDAELLNASIASKSDKGRIYSRFRGRLIFPIFSRDGKVVGFGGRVLEKEAKGAKYLNSSENEVFQKRSLLYGLNMARDEAVSKKAVMITEGYMDVIACHQSGIQNCVAPLGTAFTENHLNIVERFIEEVWFLFDGDAAGLKAASRALDTAVKSEVKQRVVILPDGTDPADFLMNDGRDAFVSYLGKNSLTPVEFKLKFISTFVDPEKDKVNFLREFFPFASAMESAIKRDEALKSLSEFLYVDPTVINEDFARFRASNREFGRSITEEVQAKNTVSKAELEMIAVLSAFPEFLAMVSVVLQEDDFKDQELKSLFEFLKSHPDKKTQEILTRVESPELKNLAAVYALQTDMTKEFCLEIAYKIKVKSLTEKRKAMLRMLPQMESAEKRLTIEEINRLEEEIKEMKNRQTELIHFNLK